MRSGQLEPSRILAVVSITAAILSLLPCRVEAQETTASATQAEEKTSETEEKTPETEKKVDWRHDHSIKRRPGSYLGGGIDYTQMHVWLEANDDHDDLKFGPLHTWGINFRVGDAFTDWFAIGFQLLLSSINREGSQTSMFGLLLDTSFYPWRGLGIRPAVGIGMAFAQGKNDWEMGSGGPGCLSLAILYEIRVTRFFSIAPMVQTAWIVSDGYDGVYIFIGLEFMKWFRTATS